jgi:hypothetical protein
LYFGHSLGATLWKLFFFCGKILQLGEFFSKNLKNKNCEFWDFDLLLKLKQLN